MDDKRKLRRRHLIYYLRVFDRATDKLIGHLVDITSDGAMLISENQITPEVIFKLHMILPSEIDEKVYLDFEGLSIWCKRDVNPDFFVTGFKFNKISDQDVKTISLLIEEFGFFD